MGDRVEITELFEVYNTLLTERRREICTLYYLDDLSLGEIAEIQGTSRQSVSDALKIARSELADYESKLGLLEIKRRLKKLAGELGGEAAKRITEIIE